MSAPTLLSVLTMMSTIVDPSQLTLGVHRPLAKLRNCPTARVLNVEHAKVAPGLLKPPE